MAMSDYDTKLEDKEVTGKVDKSVRFSIAPAEPEETAGVGMMFTDKVRLRLSDASNGRLMAVPDLKVQFLLNNALSGGEQDFSSGETTYDISDLVLGKNRITANIVGFGVSVIGGVQITKKTVTQQKINIDSFDAYFTGSVQKGVTLNVQVWPAKAGVQIDVTRRDSREKVTIVTDNRGFGYYPNPHVTTPQQFLTITRPTDFDVVCPVHEPGKGPEQLCLIPPPTGIPKKAKKRFFQCAIALGSITLLIILLGNILPQWGPTQKVINDPIIARTLRARNNYIPPAVATIVATARVHALRTTLWWGFGVSFIAIVITGILCVTDATKAGLRNHAAKKRESRMGREPQQAQSTQSSSTTPTATQGSTHATTNVVPASSEAHQQMWAIIREVIAEIFVNATAQGVRWFKIK